MGKIRACVCGACVCACVCGLKCDLHSIALLFCISVFFKNYLWPLIFSHLVSSYAAFIYIHCKCCWSSASWHKNPQSMDIFFPDKVIPRSLSHNPSLQFEIDQWDFLVLSWKDFFSCSEETPRKCSWRTLINKLVKDGQFIWLNSAPKRTYTRLLMQGTKLLTCKTRFVLM